MLMRFFYSKQENWARQLLKCGTDRNGFGWQDRGGGKGMGVGTIP